jgi:hypothetical protein
MGFIQRFEAQTVSGASTSSYIDMGTTNFQEMAVKYVTMSTGALVTLYGADAMTPNSAASATFYPIDGRTVATAISGQNWETLTPPPHRFIQFVTSAVVSGGVSFSVVARGQ